MGSSGKLRSNDISWTELLIIIKIKEKRGNKLHCSDGKGQAAKKCAHRN